MCVSIGSEYVCVSRGSEYLSSPVDPLRGTARGYGTESGGRQGAIFSGVGTSTNGTALPRVGQ